jgi:enoyl-CoA hydratase
VSTEAAVAPGLVLSELSDRILTLTVNRPDKMNALNSDVMAALASAFAEAKSSDAVGVVILTGSGEKAFVAGADIGELSKLTPISGRDHARKGQAVLDAIEALGKPVIAAIGGFALGGGCELAMACTMRIASTKARFGQPEVNLGIIPGYGGTQRLARLVGEGRAMELCLTGDMIGADEAHRIGLVNRVVEPEQLIPAARELAAKILAKGPIAVRMCLEAIHRGMSMPLAEGLALETDLFGLVASSEDMKEGMTAFLEKRKPEFRGR